MRTEDHCVWFTRLAQTQRCPKCDGAGTRGA
jgi:hypothetical protein